MTAKRVIVELTEDLNVKVEGFGNPLEAIGLLEMGKNLISGLLEEKLNDCAD